MTRHNVFPRLEKAILRRPTRNMVHNTTIGVPDFQRAQLQHVALAEALKACGMGIVSLGPDSQFPDCSKIADMAVATEHLAILSNFRDDNPRQGEQQAAASVLAGCRFVKFIMPPGQFDAGDVLRLGNRFFIALSSRTNAEGASQLAFYLKESGYEADVLKFEDGITESLRLASAAVQLDAHGILIRAEIAQHFAFVEYDKLVVSYEDRNATNALMANGTLILPQGHPALRNELRVSGIPLIEVNVSEFEKADGGLSSLVMLLPGTQKKAEKTLAGWNRVRETAAA